MRETHDQNLPIAVYGTLREGECNARLWEDFGGVSLPCKILGFRLVQEDGGWFPYAIPADGETTVGEIIVFWGEDPDIAVANYKSALARMDRLEGVPRFYNRVVADVEVGGIKFDAWLYVPADPSKFSDLPLVRNNDWCAA